MHFKTVWAHLKSKTFSVGQPWWPTFFHIETCWNHIFVLDPPLGFVTIDRFASEKNRKTVRSNSKTNCPETLGVAAFTFDRPKELNWLVPPVHLIGKAVKYFHSQQDAILVRPYWTSSTFFQLIVTEFKGTLMQI